MFTAIGRFIGLSLWFSNTVPLNFSRHVVKFLLERYSGALTLKYCIARLVRINPVVEVLVVIVISQ